MLLEIRKIGARHKFYRAWQAMLNRCRNPKVENFHSYGGRGISVCDKWSTLEGFYEDMYDSFVLSGARSSLDRIDNNLGYYKENCRWATVVEQNNNRRSNHVITFNGKTQTIEQWARESGLKTSTFRQRFYCYRWPFDKCFTPLKARIKTYSGGQIGRR